MRYTTTTEDLVTDQKARVALFADTYQKKTRTREPGMPLQAWVDGNNLPVSGVVDADEFAKLVASNPHQIFQEVKLRCFMAMAYAEQVKELHATAQTLDNNMKLIHDWVPALVKDNDDHRTTVLEDDRVVNDIAATIADQ